MQAAARRSIHVVRVPNVPLTHMGQVKVARLLTLARGLVKPSDVIVCLSGLAGSRTCDTIVVTEVGREFEIVATDDRTNQMPEHVLPKVIERLIDLASQLGNEGREDKPVGALFVMGDTERVLSMSRQLILNPFRGYDESERNMLNPQLKETIKEMATLDGAFILRGDGVIETCGAFLKTAATTDDTSLPQGLGARHHAAAAITALSDSMA